jgi:hypothetical protein
MRDDTRSAVPVVPLSRLAAPSGQSESEGPKKLHAMRGVILHPSSFILCSHPEADHLTSYTTLPPTIVRSGLMSLIWSSGTLR